MRVSAHAFSLEFSIAVEPRQPAAAPAAGAGLVARWRAARDRARRLRADRDLAWLDDHMRADLGFAPDQGPRLSPRERLDWLHLQRDVPF
ncbi:hypothetical protein [Falsiroseomonas sp.]|uniref:hypothetical protein n=1 Tax=Falsiroseomonas sp. TaxID=2870721 RepID=UPI00356925AB